MMSFRSKGLNKPAGAASNYHDQMHQMWQADPASVDPSWRSYFEGSSNDIMRILSGLQGSQAGSQDTADAQSHAAKVMLYVRNFISQAHLQADLDPLKLSEIEQEDRILDSMEDQKRILDLSYYGFTEADMDREVHIDIPDWQGILQTKKKWTLRELQNTLTNIYCGKVGVEYLHIAEREPCNWIREKIELRHQQDLTQEEREKILNRILWTDEFASFIGTKFNTMKRFGLEGIETMIPGLKAAIEACSNNGAQKATIGMPHRGRLSLLANVVRKPLKTIFAEF